MGSIVGKAKGRFGVNELATPVLSDLCASHIYIKGTQVQHIIPVILYMFPPLKKL